MNAPTRRLSVRRSRRIYVLLAALAALLAVSFGPTVASASAGSMQRLPGCTTNALAANDDQSSEETELGFSVNFEGNNYSKLFVNNNGNVTFGASLFQFTPRIDWQPRRADHRAVLGRRGYAPG